MHVSGYAAKAENDSRAGSCCPGSVEHGAHGTYLRTDGVPGHFPQPAGRDDLDIIIDQLTSSPEVCLTA